MEVTKWLEPDDEFRALVEKAPDADILRETIAFAAGRLMEVEVGDRTDAPKWGRFARPARPGQRLSQPGRGEAGRDGGAAYPEAAKAPIFRAFSSRGGPARPMPVLARHVGVAVVAAISTIVHI